MYGPSPTTVLQVANIRQGMDIGLLITGVPLVVLSRAVNIYPLAYLVNKGERFRKQSLRVRGDGRGGGGSGGGRGLASCRWCSAVLQR